LTRINRWPVHRVTGRATTSITDTIGVLKTQYYVAQATCDDWTSPDSNKADVHTVALGTCTQA
jgi:hypothetical protein